MARIEIRKEKGREAKKRKRGDEDAVYHDAEKKVQEEESLRAARTTFQLVIKT